MMIIHDDYAKRGYILSDTYIINGLSILGRRDVLAFLSILEWLAL
jgi:hypothetical protein